jgi:multiple RNA-binding domain-containing protein 1
MKSLLTNYGEMSRFFMPDNNALVIAEFESEKYSNNVIKNLNNYKFQGTPIYLERAPQGLFEEENFIRKRSYQDFAQTEQKEINATVFVKNLNFETTEEEISEILLKEKIPTPKTVKIVKKLGKSLGFGFIEFQTVEDAQECLKRIQGYILKNHNLKLSMSKAKEQKVEIKVEEKNNKVSCKLLIKNLAFQSNQNELKRLISNIADVKSLRCPKKVDGSLRGFAFVEFADPEESKKAKSHLENIHFYGRKLVIQYSDNS